MATIKKEGETIVMNLELGELLGKQVNSRSTFGDLIRKLAWALLWEHGQKFLKKVDVKYSTVAIIDGKISVVFYEEGAKVPKLEDK
ncbi:MAG TPA: hypothetical protein PKD55_02545 [Bellilinea sp.]|nr:hypothetical protein [Bellilinea sp.]